MDVAKKSIDERKAAFVTWLTTLPGEEWAAFKRHFSASLTDADWCENTFSVRFIILRWMDYRGKVDNIEDSNDCDTLDASKAEVENWICEDSRPEYVRRCRVFDCDTATEMTWHEIREIRWGE